ncbi:hypothetical protein [Francisella philomiragia]|uniref:hypothetical protein n=1 Tax=Francisella philomiragia TaxID=28110 RepID=UPI001B8CCB33|nr:hypothetical protein [Francisella philomiragia]QUE32402.1 hypothetical protein IMS64_09685 [Francisella philomiragia]
MEFIKSEKNLLKWYFDKDEKLIDCGMMTIKLSSKETSQLEKYLNNEPVANTTRLNFDDDFFYYKNRKVNILFHKSRQLSKAQQLKMVLELLEDYSNQLVPNSDSNKDIINRVKELKALHRIKFSEDYSAGECYTVFIRNNITRKAFEEYTKHFSESTKAEQYFKQLDRDKCLHNLDITIMLRDNNTGRICKRGNMINYPKLVS